MTLDSGNSQCSVVLWQCTAYLLILRRTSRRSFFEDSSCRQIAPPANALELYRINTCFFERNLAAITDAFCKRVEQGNLFASSASRADFSSVLGPANLPWSWFLSSHRVHLTLSRQSLPYTV